MLQIKQVLGAIPLKYLPAEQLKHPFTPDREQVVGQLASQF
jgi:hypothetical protein